MWVVEVGGDWLTPLVILLPNAAKVGSLCKYVCSYVRTYVHIFYGWGVGKVCPP